VLAGRYRIEKVVEELATEVVVAARDLLLDVAVEIESFAVRGLRSAARVAEFIRQTRAVAQLESEHVRHILDVGVDGAVVYTVTSS
jgi:hypothetical protein